MGVEEVALESCELSRGTAGQEYLGTIVEGYGTPPGLGTWPWSPWWGH